ncbi:calcium/sodium antiporter [Bizionia argentinensis JUB59]|uniref:Calcium/sodium antiporter n=1 Tax=Bizionia argentinensis JUB59 TaxID=1046627 RepID=G2ED46_9FLAO|nr:calcium/sodium antiporter [Bizionia argentinensis]EGV43647.1 calcium/sodium antiporter [Bizionia argentinensis JUB59]
MSIVLMLLGLVLLVVGGEFLVRASVALSFKFKVSKLVIGMTVVSFATSVPELLVSLQAALDGSPDISLGNVIGSNIANIGLVLGITAFITPLAIDKDFFKLNWPMMMLLSVALYFMLQSGSVLDFKEGLALMISLVLFLFIIIRRSRKANGLDADTSGVDSVLQKTSNFKIIIWLAIGGVALYFGSDWLVIGAKDMALSMGVSERVISVTMVAIGTSVPELAASVIAALKQEKGISLGNLIGSNIFNIASVLGLTAMIHPIAVINPNILGEDMFWMLGFSGILVLLAFLPKQFSLGRYKGALLLGSYLLFVSLAFLGEN